MFGVFFLFLLSSTEAGYAVIEVTEHSGYDRGDWPVQVGVAVPAEVLTDTFRLKREVQGDELEPVAFQISGAIDPQDAWRGTLQSVDIAFLTDIDAHDTLRFRLYFGEDAEGRRKTEPEQALEVLQGEHFAVGVDTGTVRFDFFETSGQLFSYNRADTDRLIDFRGDDPIHYNPDVRLRNPGERRTFNSVRDWDVTDEERAPTYEEYSGPIAWRLVRTGLMPGMENLEASVTYTVFAGAPYIIQSSSLRFRENTSIAALMRNNELVFARGLFTHGIYIDHDNKTNTLRVFDPEDPDNRDDFQDVQYDILPADIPFIGFFHDEAGCGIGAVTLGRTVYNAETPFNAGGEGAHYYFHAHFPYLSRAELFNQVWGGQWNDAPYSIIPAGSVFTENSVFLTFPVEADGGDQSRFEELERLTKLLRNPLRVRVIKDGRR